MQILIRVDAERALASLEELGLRKKGPYILRDFLNTLAKKVQVELRKDLMASLNIRQPTFIHNAVKIDRGTFALTNRLHVTIHLEDRAEFLGQFEGGGEHIPAFGHNWLAVPNPAVFHGRIIRKTNPLRPSNLELQPHKGDMVGQLRTFLITSQRGEPMILQRISARVAKRAKGTLGHFRAKTGTRLLYQLVKASARPSKIHWYSVADQTVQGEAEGVWITVVREALDHLRARQ